MNSVPRLSFRGACSICKQDLALTFSNLGGHYVPKHEFEGASCRGARFSAMSMYRIIETEDSAREVAEFLAHDDGRCLERPWIPGPAHSMMCSDGRNCANTRVDLARSLGVWYLKCTPVNQANKEAAPA
ncbi:MAG TPA: hypothetical protein VG984_00085 [Candidatus Paceibacterota bacterium]|nr:hypothetical protein [Candidatus Paceibacterota bacterium]